jgi:hypothetical protein
MATFMRDDRKENIATAISIELNRQSQAGAHRIDVDALAAAIDHALDQGIDAPTPRMQMRQARRPDQLNATNDG